MVKIEKIECLVKGKVLKLTPEAFKIAAQYFGAERMSELGISKPIELSKPILIPKKIEFNKPVISRPIESPVEKVVVPEIKKTEVIAKEVAEPLVIKVPVRKAPVKKAVVKKVKK